MATAKAQPESDLARLAVHAVSIRDPRLVGEDVRHAGPILVGAGLLSSAVLMVAAWLVARRITRRLRAVSAAAARVAIDGATDGFPEPTGSDEVTQLARAIRSLSDRLLQEQRMLEATVAERTRELLAANRDLEAFSYSVSHDLRAPLRAIHGFAHLLGEEADGKLSPAAEERLRQVIQNAEVMSDRFEGLIALARVSREPLAVRDVPLGALAAEIAEGLARAAPERRAELAIDRTLVAQGDPRLLRLLVENLLDNAWKYTSRCELAKIEFGRNEAGEFFVRDNGIGFDMTWAGALFEPFQRMHDASHYPGTGIGLASVKRIVERHGGSMRAEAMPGRGAAFFFTLPSPAGIGAISPA